MNWFERFRNSEKAQGMIEYGLILALISVVAIGSLSGIGGRLNDTFDNVHDGGEFVRSYKVTFEDFDGTEIDVVDVIEGGDATTPEAPSREGYTFTGWNGLFENVTRDAVAVAEYEINTYSVTFVDSSGHEISKDSVNHGGKVKAPELDSSKSKYFNGYKWDKSLDNITSDTVITGEYGDVKPAYKSYTLISTPQELQAIGDSALTRRDKYLQINDIDLDDFGNFTPIGKDRNNSFTGEYDGAGFVIKNLNANHNIHNVGLFGYTQNSTLKNINLEGGSVVGNDNVGSLVGYDRGSIDNCHSNVSITGQNYTGGLVGRNNGSVTNSHTNGRVSGSGYVGGLLGQNSNGNVNHSYSTSSVTGENDRVGGLIGENWGSTVQNSHASGSVNGSSDRVGGLIGNNYSSTVLKSYSSSWVSGNREVGGFVGFNDGSISTASKITYSYSTGSVSGKFDIGGFVDHNKESDVSNCYATGSVRGQTYSTGGFVGLTWSWITDCYASGSVSSDSGRCGGLVGYLYNGYVQGGGWANDVNNEGFGSGYPPNFRAKGQPRSEINNIIKGLNKAWFD